MDGSKSIMKAGGVNDVGNCPGTLLFIMNE